ncbi:MAG: hypothetical protein OEZ10_08035 [Gammaproteobacteria bacterium]|nr:hypothetical protein [Gammaproteobacteria bacterium]
MAVRLKANWHQTKRVRKGRANEARKKTIEDRAGVVGFNVWKVARQTLSNMMEEEEFNFKSDEQTFGLMIEMVAFFIAIIDRMVYGQLSEEDRGKLITGAAKHLAQTIAENQLDVFGEGDYIQPFFTTLNERFGEYATCSYENGEPGHNFKRVVARHVADVMETGENKWVLEWVMDIEVPKAVPLVKKLVASALGVNPG